MSELKQVDDTEKNEEILDNLELPYDDYYRIINMTNRLGIPPPELDVFASELNSKCTDCITKEMDAYHTDWLLPDTQKKPTSIYINAPHSKYEKAVKRIHNQFIKHDYSIICLIPSNNERTYYWRKLVEQYRIDVNKLDGYIFYFPYDQPITFELNGKPMPYHSRNSYKITLWIGSKDLRNFRKNLPTFYDTRTLYG